LRRCAGHKQEGNCKGEEPGFHKEKLTNYCGFVYSGETA
jgi:hypothetical protein